MTRFCRRIVGAVRLDPQTYEEVEAGPGGQIVAYASEHEAGLIIMASGEHGRVARFVPGSVAAYVVRAAACPVLIIPVHAHPASVTAPLSPAYAA